ncbi:hypothetical protein AGLY_015528 [Aphis glycines]|uniref:Uncharacterized protein n=1 Tax=Aphis glycines TaxID=307491 RepID=A0A6G0T2B6_APHGL|nr:hypothetical protein AGLY_015528 [Aphis glycines]
MFVYPLLRCCLRLSSIMINLNKSLVYGGIYAIKGLSSDSATHGRVGRPQVKITLLSRIDDDNNVFEYPERFIDAQPNNIILCTDIGMHLKYSFLGFSTVKWVPITLAPLSVRLSPVYHKITEMVRNPSCASPTRTWSVFVYFFFINIDKPFLAESKYLKIEYKVPHKNFNQMHNITSIVINIEYRIRNTSSVKSLASQSETDDNMGLVNTTSNNNDQTFALRSLPNNQAGVPMYESEKKPPEMKVFGKISGFIKS